MHDVIKSLGMNYFDLLIPTTFLANRRIRILFRSLCQKSYPLVKDLPSEACSNSVHQRFIPTTLVFRDGFFAISTYSVLLTTSSNGARTAGIFRQDG